MVKTLKIYEVYTNFVKKCMVIRFIDVHVRRVSPRCVRCRAAAVVVTALAVSWCLPGAVSQSVSQVRYVMLHVMLHITHLCRRSRLGRSLRP